MVVSSNPASYTVWTFFHIYLLQKLKCVFEMMKINEKEAGFGPFIKKDFFTKQIQNCLAGKSGHKFSIPTHLARSSESPIPISARCKLDSILCGLFGNSTHVSCSSKLEKCKPLLTETPNCECAELTLSDGRFGDCSNVDSERNLPFCFVKSSPCVVRDRSGFVVESSSPVSGTNGLLHLSYEACKFKNYF